MQHVKHDSNSNNSISGSGNSASEDRSPNFAQNEGDVVEKPNHEQEIQKINDSIKVSQTADQYRSKS